MMSKYLGAETGSNRKPGRNRVGRNRSKPGQPELTPFRDAKQRQTALALFLKYRYLRLGSFGSAIPTNRFSQNHLSKFMDSLTNQAKTPVLSRLSRHWLKLCHAALPPFLITASIPGEPLMVAGTPASPKFCKPVTDFKKNLSRLY